ncbi:MAG: formylglycine-generating enzyme family protein [Verrucomicrobiota bacterium]
MNTAIRGVCLVVVLSAFPMALSFGDNKRYEICGLPFVYCQKGTFRMGLKSRFQTGRIDGKVPVALSQGFFMMETEVTQAMWLELMGRTMEEQYQKYLETTTEKDRKAVTPSNDHHQRARGDHYPVFYVSWEECKMFCEVFQKRLEGSSDPKFKGFSASLPTEAQWEYACRAGTTSYYHTGKDRLLPEEANFRSGGRKFQAYPVKSFEKNAWGLYDMHGNVWEWVEDFQGPRLRKPQIDPKGPATGRVRLFRGGSFASAPESCKSSSRFWPGGHRYHKRPSSFDRGFRVVLNKKSQQAN